MVVVVVVVASVTILFWLSISELLLLFSWSLLLFSSSLLLFSLLSFVCVRGLLLRAFPDIRSCVNLQPADSFTS